MDIVILNKIKTLLDAQKSFMGLVKDITEDFQCLSRTDDSLKPETRLVLGYFDKCYETDIAKELESIGFFKRKIDESIKKICQHDIITDTIDRTPDDSMEITYCKNCFLDF